jgi:hypothetical protein
MVRADTLARSRRLGRTEPAYLARFAGRDGTVDLEISWAELTRDTQWVTAALRGLGLTAGRRALLVGSGFEGPWLRPMMDALRALGVTYGIAEALGWDANRTVVFNRELDLHAVIGLSEPVAERLGDPARLREMFGSTPVVLGRPAAAALLRTAGVPAGVLCFVGPALAIECAQRRGAHVNGAEWQVTARDGELWIAGAGRRVDRLPDTPLGIRAAITTAECECGSRDPRVILS